MTNLLKKGSRVIHKNLGPARIIDISSDGWIHIQCQNGDRRRIDKRFALENSLFTKDESSIPPKQPEIDHVSDLLLPADNSTPTKQHHPLGMPIAYHGFDTAGSFYTQPEEGPPLSLREGLDAVQRIFSPGGDMAKLVNGHSYRSAQFEMASEIAKAIDAKAELMAEAGTGTGKTFAYLIPSLMMGNRVIVSTQTKNLQDQLMNDVKNVETLVGRKIKAAVLKGRDNYLCIRRLKEARRRPDLISRPKMAEITHINFAVENGRLHAGQKGEFESVSDDVWGRIRCSSESCMDRCQYEKACYFKKARAAAHTANITIVNHSLFLLNARLKAEDNDFESLLPSDVSAVVFDEAHHIPATASEVFGDQISAGILNGIVDDVLNELAMLDGESMQKWKDLAENIQHAFSNIYTFEIRQFLRNTGNQALERKDLNIGQIAADIRPALDQLAEQLGVFAAALKSRAERTEALKKYAEKIGQITEQLADWIRLAFDEHDFWQVIWLEIKDNRPILRRAPLSVKRQLRTCFDHGEHAWIFTSATISTQDAYGNSDFSYFAEQMSLDQANRKTWPSPFNYADIGRLYVPTATEMPGRLAGTINNVMETPAQREDYWRRLVDTALPVIHACKGGTFILCTSNKAVEVIGRLISREFANTARTVLVQAPNTDKNRIIETFRKLGNGVLVATKSFWEGVDVRGEALSLVIIERLPFDPLTPLFNARTALEKQRGGNAFMKLSLPECLITLRQGAGRLIRSETDRGVLMICDRRIDPQAFKNYRYAVINSLPPFSMAADRQEAIDFLQNRPTD